MGRDLSSSLSSSIFFFMRRLATRFAMNAMIIVCMVKYLSLIRFNRVKRRIKIIENKYKTYMSKEILSLQPCSIDDCERTEEQRLICMEDRLYCKSIYERWKKTLRPNYLYLVR